MGAVSRGGIHLLSNILLAGIAIELLRRQGRKQRLAEEAMDKTISAEVEPAAVH